MSLMKSPTKAAKSVRDQSAGERRVVLHETEGPTHIVPYNPSGAYRTFGNGTRVTPAEVLRIKQEQRNSQGLYCSEFFFPTLKDRSEGGNLTDEDRLGRTALRRTLRYLCDGTGGCRVGLSWPKPARETVTYTCVSFFVYNWSQDVEKCTLDLMFSSSTHTNAVQTIVEASKGC